MRRPNILLITTDHGDHDGEHRLTKKRFFHEAAVHVPLPVCWRAALREHRSLLAEWTRRHGDRNGAAYLAAL